MNNKLLRLLFWRKQNGAEPAGEPVSAAFLAAVRRESEIIASSFDEDPLLRTIVGQLERDTVGAAVKSIRKALSCSQADARILANELIRATKRVRGGARVLSTPED